MRTTRHGNDSTVITDAEPSRDDELRERKKIYTILMAFHLVGFAIAGTLAATTDLWWFALALAIVTGVLPWVAVILANDRRVSSKGKRVDGPSNRSPVRQHQQGDTRYATPGWAERAHSPPGRSSGRP